jgi:hypothetical protein
MGNWQDSLVYYQDFGYPNTSRRLLSMAQNIADTSAKTFAEYVAIHFSQPMLRNVMEPFYFPVVYAKHAKVYFQDR